MELSRRRLVAAGLAQIALPFPARAQVARLVEIAGARYFNGSAFVRRDLWIADARLLLDRPSGEITERVDMTGRWLVPPFADAHSHSFGEGQPARERERSAGYIRDGVFYVMSQGNLPLSPSARADLGVNTPDGPEVSFANGMIISPDGPVRGFYEAIVFPSGAFPGRDFASLADSRYFEIADEAALARKWPLIRAQQSDFIKVYLHNSERDSSVRFAPFFRGRGLDPVVLRAVVERAHAERLRVSAHVATAGDILAALDAGVDMLAHVPDGPISPEVARRVAFSRLPVVTTMAFRARSMPPQGRAVLEANLSLLVAAGARLVVGADLPADSGVGEADYLAATGHWENAALLRMWCEDTPKAIFPERTFGFVDGAPASFLALARNPLEDWSAIHDIERRMKNGVWLT